MRSSIAASRRWPAVLEPRVPRTGRVHGGLPPVVVQRQVEGVHASAALGDEALDLLLDIGGAAQRGANIDGHVRAVERVHDARDGLELPQIQSDDSSHTHAILLW